MRTPTLISIISLFVFLTGCISNKPHEYTVSSVNHEFKSKIEKDIVITSFIYDVRTRSMSNTFVVGGVPYSSPGAISSSLTGQKESIRKEMAEGIKRMLIMQNVTSGSVTVSSEIPKENKGVLIVLFIKDIFVPMEGASKIDLTVTTLGNNIDPLTLDIEEKGSVGSLFFSGDGCWECSTFSVAQKRVNERFAIKFDEWLYTYF